MTEAHLRSLRRLQGHHVSVALDDGETIEDAELVSAGHGHVATMWLATSEGDRFIPVADVIAMEECAG